MKRLLLIAQREFRAVALRPRFLVMALFPILIGAISFGSSVLSGKNALGAQGYAYLILEQDGSLRQALAKRLQSDNDYYNLEQFAVYLGQNHLQAPVAWAQFPEQIGPEEQAAMHESGGMKPALAKLDAGLPKDAVHFHTSDIWFHEGFIPGILANANSIEQVAAEMPKRLGHSIETAVGPRPLALVMWKPQDGGAPTFWTTDSGHNLQGTISGLIQRQKRAAAWEKLGISAAELTNLDPERMAFRLGVLPKEGGFSAEQVKNAVGMGVGYLSFVIILMTSGMLLQATMEEKSGRLMESLVSIATPDDILSGKLLAMAGVAVLLAFLWTCMAFLLVALVPNEIKLPILKQFFSVLTPFSALRLLFYFVTGYVIMAIPFLAVGAMCETPQDAQPFQMALSVSLMPIFVVMGTVITNPESNLFSVIVWVPFYTPFSMMARIGQPVPLWEIAATALLTVAFIYWEIRLMGRFFRAVLLRTGQPPKLREVWKLVSQE